MALQLLIGGVDYTPYTDLSSLRIDNNIAAQNDTLDIDIIIPNFALPRPKADTELILFNGSNREFAGVITDPEEEQLAVGVMKYATKVRDYTPWLDKRLVVEDITGWTADQIVDYVVQNYTTGFTTQNVQPSFTVPTQKFNYVQPSRVIKNLADSISWGWYIDYDKDVHFYAMESFLSPLPGNIFDADNDLINYGDLIISENASQVKNRIYLKGYKYKAGWTKTDSWVADGQQTTFDLSYQPYRGAISILVGGINYPAKNDIVDGLPTTLTNDGYGYVNYVGQKLRFNVAPVSGTVVTMTYNPMLYNVTMVEDPAAQQVMAERDGTDGIFENVIDDPRLTSDGPELAQLRGQLALYKYGYPHISGSFYSYLQGWRAGQHFVFQSQKRMDGELDGETLYVTKVTKTITNHPLNGTPILKSQISFSDSPYVY